MLGDSDSALRCAGMVTRQEQCVRLQSAGLSPPVSPPHTWLCGRKHRLISPFKCLSVEVVEGFSVSGKAGGREIDRKEISK